jgi:hypothetical protein
MKNIMNLLLAGVLSLAAMLQHYSFHRFKQQKNSIGQNQRSEWE